MDRNLSPVEDTTRGEQFWLRCVDCGGALATARTLDHPPETLLMLARPFFKMLAFKLDLSPEFRAAITSENPFSILSDEKLLAALFTLRCADCTVKANGENAAA